MAISKYIVFRCLPHDHFQLCIVHLLTATNCLYINEFDEDDRWFLVGSDHGSIRKGADKADRRPNFIIIYTDDQRQDGLGINDNPVIKTPSLDRIAREAVRFTNANVVFFFVQSEPRRAANRQVWKCKWSSAPGECLT